MKKVLIITYYWPPSGGAGVQRWLKFVKYLVKMEVQLFVLTIDPDSATYPQIDTSLEKDIPKDVKVFKTGAFNIYQFYKKLSSNKEVPYGGFANTQKLDFKEKVMRFIRGNFFLPDPRKSWNKSAYKKALQIIDEHNIKTVITTSPPHSTQLIGLKLKKNRRVNWIADLRDPWTDIFYYKQLYPTVFADAIQKKYEKQVLEYADNIVTVSNSLKNLFWQKINIIDDKITVIPNGFDEEDFIDKIVKKPEKFTIAYVGTLSNEYPLSGFINALKELPEPQKENFLIQFVGKVDAGVIYQFKTSGFKNNLQLVDYVPHNTAIDFMMNADLLLLVIPEAENNEGILTGKLFEYMASGTPILFIGPKDGDAAEIIRETRSGKVFGYQESLEIKEYLQQIVQQPTEKQSLQHEIQKYSREDLTRKLIEKL